LKLRKLNKFEVEHRVTRDGPQDVHWSD